MNEEAMLDALAVLIEHGMVETAVNADGETVYRPTEEALAISERHPEWTTEQVMHELRMTLNNRKGAQ